MNHQILGLTALFPVLGMLATALVSAGEDDRTVVARILAEYYSAFSTTDMQAFSPYYHEPCFIVAPPGVVALPNHAALVATLRPAIEDLRKRGFGRSELTMLNIKQLSATTMLASGTAVRYKTDGQELERAGVTYLLQKLDGNWKIAVVVVHDANNRLRLE
jgi:ketosteroid isomerase-like protein